MKLKIDMHVHTADVQWFRNAVTTLLQRTAQMATLQEVKDAIAAEGAQVAARVNELGAEIQRLRDQIAAGTAATPADLDDLKAMVEGIFTPTA